MIVKGLKQKKYFQNWMLPTLLSVLLIGLVIAKVGFPAKGKKGNTIQKQTYYCGAEMVDGDNFVSDGVRFGGGATQTTEYVRTGKYASKLDSNHQFGMTFKMENPLPGKTYKAEIWRYTKKTTNSFLVVSAEDSKAFYGFTDKDVENDGGWWHRMEYIFTVPKYKDVKTLNIYVYKEPGDGIVIFDDFKITQLDTIKDFDPDQFEPQDFYVKIDKAGLDKLKEVKERSFSYGVLVQTDEDRIKAKVTTANGLKEAKIRLKGDWLDHIFNGKSSFRIQLKSDDSWQGMQTFSIQHPKTRSLLREWVYHQFLDYVDVLSPRYDFINFHYNEDKPIIYAYEEHFNKNLVENKLRREGPIIKFTEDRFWEGMTRSLQGSRKMAEGSNKELAYWTSEIKPFKESKTVKNPTLKQAFEVAQNLLQQYKYGLKMPSEVFDLDRMAKYLAVTDLVQAKHSLTWHNQRFYYNPVSALLEPIGFDGFGSHTPDNPNAPLYSQGVYAQNNFSTEPLDRLFYDDEFLTLYSKYLVQYANPTFIKQFLAEIEEPLADREEFLRKDYKDYSFNRDLFLKRGIKLQENILPFGNSLQAFRKEERKDSMTLQLMNGHILPLEIVYIGKEKQRPIADKTTWVFPSTPGNLPDYTTVTVPSWATTIHYQLPGVDSIYKAAIPAWKAPNSWSPRQELLANIESSEKPYTEIGDLILFEKKVYQITKPLVLPKGKKVVFEPGTHIKFSKNGFLLSFSSIEMRGDEEEPIIVESLDGKSGSFTVMQAEKSSFMRYVVFKNQNTLAYKGWNLTGAVTFYESDVNIAACRFIDNRCEDGLNIVRANFEVKECLFQGIFSDAFDADFCKGFVQGCGFKNIKNDALDFSTSVIEIDNCKMDGVGDKAISAGEHATITASNIDVNKANIGFASKDLSVLTLDNVSLTATSKGFTAYQKKPEYGAATINLKKHQMTNVKFPFLIESGSVLNK